MKVFGNNQRVQPVRGTDTADEPVAVYSQLRTPIVITADTVLDGCCISVGTHSAVIGEFLTILDGQRVFQQEILVATPTQLTTDIGCDRVYPAGSTAFYGPINMAFDYSTIITDYIVSPPPGSVFLIKKTLLNFVGGSPPDQDRFGCGPALIKGAAFLIRGVFVNKNIGSARNNATLIERFDKFSTMDRAPAGVYSITFQTQVGEGSGGDGFTMLLTQYDNFIIRMNDDLTGNAAIRVHLRGHSISVQTAYERGIIDATLRDYLS